MRARLVTIAAAFALVLAGSAEPAVAKGCKGKTIKGTAKADVLKGTCGPDRILGRGGNDRISGGKGNDKIVGGPGSDSVNGGPGKDSQAGSAGDDSLTAGSGLDTLDGGPGRDTGQFEGTIAGETIAITSAAGHLSLSGGANGVDSVAIEAMSVKTAAGIDSVTIGELAPSGLGVLGLDLGEGDSAPDRVTFNGSAASDSTGVVGSGPATEVTLLGTLTKVTGTAANDRLTVNGLGGNDTIAASGNLASLVPVSFDGGDGDDVLGGANGADELIGGPGNDTFTGGDGRDTINGGGGADTANGNGGDDTVALGDDNDSYAFDPGEGNDTVDGDGGQDSVHFNGQAGVDAMVATAEGGRLQLSSFGSLSGAGLEAVTLDARGGADTVGLGGTLNGAGVETIDVDLGAGDGAADLAIVNGTSAADTLAASAGVEAVDVLGLPFKPRLLHPEAADRLAIQGGGDADTLSTVGSLAALIALTLQGDDGDDTIVGGNGADTLLGGTGNDQVEGEQSGDTVSLGAGEDTFEWSPGDGNDSLEGGDEKDTLSFTGNSAPETVNASADGGSLRVTRDVGGVLITADFVENLRFAPRGSIDSVVVGDLSNTAVANVDIDLGVAEAGDASFDTVSVSGTAGVDVVAAASIGANVQVTGISPQVDITHEEVANDRLIVNGLGGNDTLSGGALNNLTQLTLDGGEGGDIVNGGNGPDTLVGGAGADTVDGNQGNDTSFLGPDADTFNWDPGDGSDIVEGQGDKDTLRFNGSAGAEIFAASSNGGRLLFTRNVGNIVMDADDVEVLDLNALGGTDTTTINDLTPTDADLVDLDLGVNAVGDGAVDAVTLNGTTGADTVGVTGAAGSVVASSGWGTLEISRAEPANDTLTINTAAGEDAVNAAGLLSTSVLLTLNGGANDDTLVGSAGNDTINGEAGNDTIKGGPGNDTLNGGAETDYIDGGSGTDSATLGETVVNVP